MASLMALTSHALLLQGCQRVLGELEFDSKKQANDTRIKSKKKKR